MQAFHYVPFAAKDHRASEETLDVVIRALIRRHPMNLRYRNAAGKASSTTIMPWSLVMYRDGFYVLARIDGSETLRLYAVERMAEATLDKSTTFGVPADFDPAEAFGRNLGLWRTDAQTERVTIAFDADAESAVRARLWPGFQSLGHAPDGRVHLVLEVPITPEIKTWVLGWGAVAEVIEPTSLRDQVAAEIAVCAKRYTID